MFLQKSFGAIIFFQKLINLSTSSVYFSSVESMRCIKNKLQHFLFDSRNLGLNTHDSVSNDTA